MNYAKMMGLSHVFSRSHDNPARNDDQNDGGGDDDGDNDNDTAIRDIQIHQRLEGANAASLSRPP